MRISPTLLLAAAALAAACPDPATSRSARAEVAARIAASSAPAEALARAVVGDLVPVVRPIPADVDPLHWTPTRDAVAELRDARLVVLAGAGLEAWATQASLPPSRVLEAAGEVSEAWLELPVMRHTHGDGEEHTHEGHDPHVWLSPDLLFGQLARIQERVARDFPDAAEELLARREAWSSARDAYQARLVEDLAPRLGGRPVLATWPCYGYLGGPLGVEVVAVGFDALDADGGATDAGLRRLEELAPESAGVLLWPVEPPPELAERLRATIGLTSVHFDALLRPDEAPLFDRLNASLDRLQAALGAR